jgi:hypothetical protein
MLRATHRRRRLSGHSGDGGGCKSHSNSARALGRLGAVFAFRYRFSPVAMAGRPLPVAAVTM